jgi:hypothetical protein
MTPEERQRLLDRLERIESELHSIREDLTPPVEMASVYPRQVDLPIRAGDRLALLDLSDGRSRVVATSQPVTRSGDVTWEIEGEPMEVAWTLVDKDGNIRQPGRDRTLVGPGDEYTVNIKMHSEGW